MADANELPPEKSVARLRYLNTPTSNWAADRIEELFKMTGDELEEAWADFDLLVPRV